MAAFELNRPTKVKTEYVKKKVHSSYLCNDLWTRTILLLRDLI